MGVVVVQECEERAAGGAGVEPGEEVAVDPRGVLPVRPWGHEGVGRAGEGRVLLGEVQGAADQARAEQDGPHVDVVVVVPGEPPGEARLGPAVRDVGHEPGRVVPPGGQERGERRGFGVERPVPPDGQLVRPLAREHAGVRRGRPGGRGKGVVEPHPAGRVAGEVRRRVLAVPVERQALGPDGVGVEDDPEDVRARRAGRAGRGFGFHLVQQGDRGGERHDHADEPPAGEPIEPPGPRRDEPPGPNRQARGQDQASRRGDRTPSQQPEVSRERQQPRRPARRDPPRPGPRDGRQHQPRPGQHEQAGRREHPGELPADVIVPRVEIVALREERGQLGRPAGHPEPGGPDEHRHRPRAVEARHVPGVRALKIHRRGPRSVCGSAEYAAPARIVAGRAPLSTPPIRPRRMAKSPQPPAAQPGSTRTPGADAPPPPWIDCPSPATTDVVGSRPRRPGFDSTPWEKRRSFR